MSKDQKSRVQCLDRAIDILEALSRHDGVGVTELASEVNLHVATTHNLLTVLLARNYVLNQRGVYRLGPALSALTNQSDPLLHLAQLAQPHLDEITRRTGESAVTGLLSGDRLIMIATTSSVDGLTCPAVNQVFSNPLQLATGRLLVAYLPVGKWPAYIKNHQRHQNAIKAVTPVALEEWDSVLHAITEAASCSLVYGKESCAFAVPVYDARGVVVAALGSNSVSRLADHRRYEEWIEAIREAGDRLSKALGYIGKQNDTPTKPVRT